VAALDVRRFDRIRAAFFAGDGMLGTMRGYAPPR
jgi:hypothetical protein